MSFSWRSSSNAAKVTARESSSGCLSASFFFAAQGPKKTTFASSPKRSLTSRQWERIGERKGAMYFVVSGWYFLM